MKRSHVVVLWLTAIAITVGSAAWQRRTGPSRPIRGTATLSGESVPYRLLRSQRTGEPLAVRIRASAAIRGEVLWRRHPSNETLRREELVRHGEELTLDLPAQPPPGELEYFVHLTNGLESVELPPQTVVPRKGAVARFAGAVPAHIVVPHLAVMFLGLLFSNAAALSALARRDQAWRQAWVAFVLLAVGGLLLEPAVQRYAVDAWWTGWPFGHDLASIKSAVVVAAWGIAVAVAGRSRGARGGHAARRWAAIAIITAAVLTLAAFIVPPGMYSSELNVQ